MPKLTNLKSTDSQVAWCARCKEEFLTYNLALAKCPRCGGTARTSIKRLALRVGTFFVVAAVIVLVCAGAYMFLRGRGIVGDAAAAEEPAPGGAD